VLSLLLQEYVLTPLTGVCSHAETPVYFYQCGLFGSSKWTSRSPGHFAFCCPSPDPTLGTKEKDLAGKLFKDGGEDFGLAVTETLSMFATRRKEKGFSIKRSSLRCYFRPVQKAIFT
jgi:hypothetical protein